MNANDVTLILNINSQNVSGSYNFTESLSNFRYVAFAINAGYSRYNIFPVVLLLAMQNLNIYTVLNMSFKENYYVRAIIEVNDLAMGFIENQLECTGWAFSWFRVYGIGRIL